MNVIFPQQPATESDVFDEATGRLLFSFTTPELEKGDKRRTTTMRDAYKRVIAEYENKREGGWGHATLTYRGVTKRSKEWYPKSGFWVETRTFTAPNGKEYVWKAKMNSIDFKLTNTATKAIAAESHRATYGILTAKRDLRLEVTDPELVPFLDAVVLSFVICQKEEYYDTVERSDTIATVADAGATVAVAVT